jgi:hypothetical protein
MIHHLVVFRIKKDTKPAQITRVFADLDGLKKKIPGLLSFAGGPYSSPEGLNQGFTHGFAMTFRDSAARDGYLTHPEHEKVKERILPLLEGGLDGVIAFDFSA